MKIPGSGRSDLTDLLVWFATALLVLALVNGLKKVVPLEKLPDPAMVMNSRRR